MLERFEPHAYALLRIVTGVFFMMHGTQKLFGWPANGPAPSSLPPLILAAGIIELAGGLLTALGLFTRTAAFLSSGTMAFAYFLSHFPSGWNPVVNHGELAAVYAFLFLVIATRGAGIGSIESMRTGSRATVTTTELRETRLAA